MPVQYSYTPTPLWAVLPVQMPVQLCTFTFTFHTSITYRVHYHSHYNYARSYNGICSLYCIYGFVWYRHLNVRFTGFLVGPVTDLELSVEVLNECHATQRPLHQCQMIRDKFFKDNRTGVLQAHDELTGKQ